MKALRLALLTLLLVAMLPWGAWMSQRAVPPQAGVTQLEAAGGSHAAKAPHRCRTGILPGQVCGHDLAVLPGIVPIDPRPAGLIGREAGAALPRDVVPGVLVPPPKAV